MLGSRVSRSRTQPTTARARSGARPRPAEKGRKQTSSGVRAASASTHRPLLLLMVIVIAAGGLVSRLVFWQVMQHARLAAAATEQHNALIVEPALRGQIFDADGTPLATDINLNLVYAVPQDIKDPHSSAVKLAPILNQSVKRLEDLLSGFATYAQLAPSVSAATSKQIYALKLPGIFLTPVVRRAYPERQVAAQVLGYTDVDNHGNYGLEQYYDYILSGRAGLRTVLKDTAGNNVRLSKAIPTPARNGGNLYLSLDGFVQNAVETELQSAVRKHHADSGTIIVMDPRTGYILGMASTPSYDPNNYAKSSASPQVFLNPATSWTYEPGSTFKIITMAAGLDSGVVTPETSFDDTGAWPVGDVVLHNWNMQGNGIETMTQVLQHSANVGASFVSSRLGATRFYKYVRRFGIGSPTGIDLSGEEKGILPLPGQKDWTIVNQFTNSFGQGLAATPIQMLRAVSTVANGGVMMRPQLVKRMVFDGHVISRPPVLQGQIISRRTAHTLTKMLVQSAIGGEAQLGLVHGYNIAAKTGTANIPAPGGGYIDGATIASITGYAPAFNPRFAILVIINRPRDTPWGSTAAAPVLKDLFQDLFMHYHIPPSPHALYP